MYDNKTLSSSFEVEIAIKISFNLINSYENRIWINFAKHEIDDLFNQFKRQ